jgi:hypothetical protein
VQGSYLLSRRLGRTLGVARFEASNGAPASGHRFHAKVF